MMGDDDWLEVRRWTKKEVVQIIQLHLGVH